jgi:hypothetical protein
MRTVVMAWLLLAGGAGTAHADWFITPYLGLKFAGDSGLFGDLDQGASNTKLTLGVSTGIVGDGILGVEADVGYSPRFFERSTSNLVARSNVLTVMGNVMVMAPRNLTGYSLRPFVSGGAGLMHIGIDDVLGILPVDSNLFAVNVGGGATGYLTNRTSVRFDLRWFKSVTREEELTVLAPSTLSFWRAAVGLTFR